MKLTWEVSTSDVRKVREFLARHRQTQFVRDRVARNLSKTKPKLGRDEVWEVLVGCVITLSLIARQC